jgi:cation-transporting P-type ATPase F
MQTLKTRAWHKLPAEAVVERPRVNLSTGLAADQVRCWQKEFGLNRVTLRSRAPAWLKLLRQINQPLVYILLAASAVTAALGEWVDSYCTVRRDHRRQHVDPEELVPGDVVLLEPGDRVPADLRLLSVRGLRVDESPSTGESASVHKQTDPLALDTPAFEAEPSGALRAALTATSRPAGSIT